MKPLIEPDKLTLSTQTGQDLIPYHRWANFTPCTGRIRFPFVTVVCDGTEDTGLGWWLRGEFSLGLYLAVQVEWKLRNVITCTWFQINPHNT